MFIKNKNYKLIELNYKWFKVSRRFSGLAKVGKENQK